MVEAGLSAGVESDEICHARERALGMKGCGLSCEPDDVGGGGGTLTPVADDWDRRTLAWEARDGEE